MTFSHFNRRLHLYLALFLLPWFLMYGVSSIFFSHPALGAAWYDDDVPDWKLRFEKPFEAPADGDLDELGARIVKECGLEGSFGTYREGPDRINVYVHTFWASTRVQYQVPQKRIVAEDRRFMWNEFLTGMHARGGYGHPLPLDDAWAAVVDLACLGFLVWVGSGLYMWWQMRRLRFWGWLALGSGTAAFTLFLILL